MHAVYHTNLDTRLRLERINSTSYAYICIYIYICIHDAHMAAHTISS